MENIKIVRNLIKDYMALDDNHCYIYNNKILMPEDKGLFVVLGIVSNEIIGNNLKYRRTDEALYAITSTSFATTYSVDIFSYDTSARERQYEVINCLGSFESLQSQEQNGYSIARIPTSFTDLSNLEASKILNRYRATFKVFHKKEIEKVAKYYDKLGGFRTIVND